MKVPSKEELREQYYPVVVKCHRVELADHVRYLDDEIGPNRSKFIVIDSHGYRIGAYKRKGDKIYWLKFYSKDKYRRINENTSRSV